MTRVGVERQGGRAWKCLLCPAKGVAVDERSALAAFEAHYAAMHMEKGEGNA